MLDISAEEENWTFVKKDLKVDVETKVMPPITVPATRGCTVINTPADVVFDYLKDPMIMKNWDRCARCS